MLFVEAGRRENFVRGSFSRHVYVAKAVYSTRDARVVVDIWINESSKKRVFLGVDIRHTNKFSWHKS